MSRLLPEKPRVRRMALAVSRHELAWATRDENGLDRIHRRSWNDDPATAMRAALSREPGSPSVRQVALIAANDLALHWLQTPPGALASFEELRLVAQARCAHLYGGAPADWWVTADWRADAPFVCAALPRAVVQPLDQALAALGSQVHWHTAWGLLCAARATAFPSNGWSAFRSPAQVILWHCGAGRVDSLSALPADAAEDSASAAARALQQMRVEASRAQGVVVGTLHWLDLAASEGSPTPEGAQAVHLGTPRRPDRTALAESTAALALRELLQGGFA